MARFLEKLWDETVAGPTPDSGIGTLRTHDSNPLARSISTSVDRRPKLPVSRSITLLRTRSLPIGSGPDPSSPSSSSSPSSPVSPGTPSEDNMMMRRFTRRKPPTMEAIEDADPRSPTVYHWILISALDR